MRRLRLLTARMAFLSAGIACGPVAPSEPETPTPPGPLEPEHRGQFVPQDDQPPAPAPKSMLVDDGGPR